MPSIAEISTAVTRSMPWSCAAASASSTPFTESWSESASSSTPASAAAATTSAGGNAPSEWIECDWRSNVGASSAKGAGEYRPGLRLGVGRLRVETLTVVAFRPHHVRGDGDRHDDDPGRRPEGEPVAAQE